MLLFLAIALLSSVLSLNASESKQITKDDFRVLLYAQKLSAITPANPLGDAQLGKAYLKANSVESADVGGRWRFDADDWASHSTQASLILETNHEGQTIVLMERPQRVLHAVLSEDKAVPFKGLYFDGRFVSKPALAKKFYGIPAIGEMPARQYASEECVKYGNPEGHEGHEVIHVEPFFLRKNGKKNSETVPVALWETVRGLYCGSRELNDTEKLAGFQERAVIICDGKKLFIPIVDQRGWRKDDAEIGFLIISYDDNCRIVLTPFVEGPDNKKASDLFGKGLYQRVKVSFDLGLRQETWARVVHDKNQEDANLAPIVLTIPRHDQTFVPHFKSRENAVIYPNGNPLGWLIDKRLEQAIRFSNLLREKHCDGLGKYESNAARPYLYWAINSMFVSGELQKLPVDDHSLKSTLKSLVQTSTDNRCLFAGALAYLGGIYFRESGLADTDYSLVEIADLGNFLSPNVERSLKNAHEQFCALLDLPSPHGDILAVRAVGFYFMGHLAEIERKKKLKDENLSFKVRQPPFFAQNSATYWYHAISDQNANDWAMASSLPYEGLYRSHKEVAHDDSIYASSELFLTIGQLQTENSDASKKARAYKVNRGYRDEQVDPADANYIDEGGKNDYFGEPSQRRTLLARAAMYNYGNMMTLLLERLNASTEGVDLRGYTALHRAAQCHQIIPMKILLDHGAKIEAKVDQPSGNAGKTALHILLKEILDAYKKKENPQWEAVQCADFLISRGASLEGFADLPVFTKPDLNAEQTPESNLKYLVSILVATFGEMHSKAQ